MIFNSFINWASSLLSGLINAIFPIADLNFISNTVGYWNSYLIPYMNYANWFFPVTDLFYCISFIIGCELLIFSFKITRWIGSIITVGVIK